MLGRPGLCWYARTFAVLALLSTTVRAQSVYLSGRVLSLETGERIPGASLALLGTGRGVRANRDGEYRIALSPGQSHSTRVTALGYAPDTLRVLLTKDSIVALRLRTVAIEGGTVIVTADQSRNEGRRIMHRVIDTKGVWQNALSNYRFQVYSRINLRMGPDTASKVLMILETVASGFWDSVRGYAERIIARKQTSNLPPDINQIALFDLQNFYNDRLDVADYNVISPVATDAFDRYDFDLIGTGKLNGASVYKIEVGPLNTLYPAFSGVLWIDQNDYTIVYLDLSPNDAIKLGPLHDVHLVQTFSFIQNKFWLPNQLSFNATFKLDLPIAPVLKVEQNAVLQDYTVNGTIPDSIFKHQHGVLADADSVKPEMWTALRTIPLDTNEQHAYLMIDSMMKVPPTKVSLSPTSILFALLSQPNIYEFNRVEGSRVQLTAGIDDIADWPLSLNATVGYSFGQEQWKYSAGVRQALMWDDRITVNSTFSTNGDVSVGARSHERHIVASLGFSYFNETLRRGDAYPRIVNTLTALLLHEDYPNYYDAKGFDVDLQYLVGKSELLQRLYFRQEDSYSDTNTSNFSLLFTQHPYRHNPQINDGLWRYVGGEFNGELALGPLGTQLGLHGESGWTTSNIQTSDYYIRAGGNIGIQTKLGGWGDMSLNVSGTKLLAGETPYQRKLFLETHDGPVRATSAFHTLRPFEFEFDNEYDAQLEQDFYDLPMRLIGLHLPFNLHWIGFVDYAAMQLAELTPATTAGVGYSQPYNIPVHVAEAGFALGGILNVLRVDAAWRLTQDKPFVVTGSLDISF